MEHHLVLGRVLHLLKEFHHFNGLSGSFFWHPPQYEASLRAAVSPTGAFGFSKCHPQIMRCVGCDWLVQPQAQHIVSRLAILHWTNWTKEKDGKMGRQFCETQFGCFLWKLWQRQNVSITAGHCHCAWRHCHCAWLKKVHCRSHRHILSYLPISCIVTNVTKC